MIRNYQKYRKYLISAFYISVKAQTASQNGELIFETKPFSVEGCDYEFTTIHKNITLQENNVSDGFSLHHISYLYFSIFGTSITVLVSFIISLLMGFEKPSKIDSKLLAPCIRKYFAIHKHYVKAPNQNCEKNELM